MICRHGIAGEGVGTAAQGGKLLHHIALGHVEQLMLQIVGHTGGRLIHLAVHGELGVDGTEVRGKKGIRLGKVGPGNDADQKPVGQSLLVKCLPQLVQHNLFHFATPSIKYTVSSVTRRAASATCSAVTVSNEFARSAMVPSWPKMAWPRA